MNKKKAGFTLLELLTVITIIGLLAAMIFPTLGKMKMRARTAKAVSELKTIELALMEYYSEYSTFPTNKDTEAGNPSIVGLVNGLEKLVPKYLDTVLDDAFISSQHYTYYSSDNYFGAVGGDLDFADSCIVFSVGMNNDVTISNFNDAVTDAYPSGPLNPNIMPTSDNVYLVIDPSGREGDIRYK